MFNQELSRARDRLRHRPGALEAVARARARFPKSGDFPIAQTCCIVVIFFISGLTLRRRTSKAWASRGARLRYYAILLVTPMMGFVVVQIPFEPVEFRYGLAPACVPTTLTSGVTLVTSALGNGVMALMLTVTTNVLVYSPFLSS